MYGVLIFYRTFSSNYVLLRLNFIFKFFTQGVCLVFSLRKIVYKMDTENKKISFHFLLRSWFYFK